MTPSFSDLVGQTLTSASADKGSDEAHFVTESGKTFRLYHSQNCCETVLLEDITGDLQDLVGSPILFAEESSQTTHPEGVEAKEYDKSFLWTFYRIGTVKGTVVLRWYGCSNGYYSESVDLAVIE